MPAANSASPTISSTAPTTPWRSLKHLQAIDPDDLAAHYNLAILYRRKGMKAEAASRPRYTPRSESIPGARPIRCDYLRKHPEISTESVPWHMHTDLQTGLDASGNGSALTEEDLCLIRIAASFSVR